MDQPTLLLAAVPITGFAAGFINTLAGSGSLLTLPILILLACPLLHVFGHGSHGGHGGHGDPDADGAATKGAPPPDASTPPDASPRTPRPHTHRGDLP